MAAGIGSITWATPGHVKCATHKTFRLTCKQYDVLLERAGNCCEICGLEATAIEPWPLDIDHDPSVGKWAVRGLLCHPCNLKLRSDRRVARTPEIERYMLNAWYLEQCRLAGASPVMPPEPGLGSSLRAGGYWWMHMTLDRPSGWEATVLNNWSCKSWHDLWYQYGPLHMGEITFRLEVPSSVPRLSRRPRTQARKGPRPEARIEQALHALLAAQWRGEMLIDVAELITILGGAAIETQAAV